MGVVFQANLDQALLTLVGDDVDVFADELHRLRIAKADQGDAPQNLAVQRQLDQLGIFIGDGEQALADRIERQR
ncbi:hypothetical protein FQZ97_1113480 [compost metagenome]